MENNKGNKKICQIILLPMALLPATICLPFVKNAAWCGVDTYRGFLFPYPCLNCGSFVLMVYVDLVAKKRHHCEVSILWKNVLKLLAFHFVLKKPGNKVIK